MPNLDVLIQNGEVCHCLRAKTLFYQTDDAGDTTGAGGSEGPFWCAQTQALQGPDGKIASAEHCRPGRSCCTTT